MPYYTPRRRYTTTRRRKTYRKRTFRRNFKRKMITKRGLKQPVHYYTRFVDRGQLASSGSVGGDTTAASIFRLNQVPGYTEFQNMYDFYKIVAVKIMFIPLSNVSVPDNTGAIGVIQTATLNFYRMMSCLDYNDNTPPSTLNDIRQYKSCKVTKNNVIHKRFFYPKILNVVNVSLGAGTTVASGSGNPWLSTGSPDIEYYGIKYGWEDIPFITDNRWRVECKYYMKFKGPK